MASDGIPRRPSQEFKAVEMTAVATQPSAAPSGAMGGRPVVQEPGCASIFGCKGVLAALCLGGGGTCLTVAPYMPTPESIGITYGLGGICTLIGGGVGGREYYVARLAKSLAEGIQALRETHTALRGTVAGLQGQVQELRDSIALLEQTQGELESQVGELRRQNEEFESSNRDLQRKIEQGGEGLAEQARLLEANRVQIEKNKELISQREAQATQAREGVAHFEKLLEKAEANHLAKKEELAAVTGKLEEVTDDLEEQLRKVTEARKELDERIPQMEREAIDRVQTEAEHLRSRKVDEVTEELAAMRLREREAAKEEAKEIRAEANEEAKDIRGRAQKELEELEADYSEKSRLLHAAQDEIAEERSKMIATEEALRKEIRELRSQIASAT